MLVPKSRNQRVAIVRVRGVGARKVVVRTEDVVVINFMKRFYIFALSICRRILTERFMVILCFMKSLVTVNISCLIVAVTEECIPSVCAPVARLWLQHRKYAEWLRTE